MNYKEELIKKYSKLMSIQDINNCMTSVIDCIAPLFEEAPKKEHLTVLQALNGILDVLANKEDISKEDIQSLQKASNSFLAIFGKALIFTSLLHVNK